jgi:hypothetical protein
MPAIEHNALNAAASPMDAGQEDGDSKSGTADLLFSSGSDDKPTDQSSGANVSQSNDILDLIGWNSGGGNGTAGGGTGEANGNAVNLVDLNDLLGGGLGGW